jgi:ceramide glucosyltransferase
MSWLAGLCAALAGAGVVQAMAGWWLVRRFAARTVPAVADLPPVTILKPLHGDEPLLHQALASLFRQHYQRFQVVFGVADRSDPALRVVEALREAFPERDVAVVIDPARHGPNLKVGNLINMLPAAKYDVLVIADSDVHAQQDYLRRLMQPLMRPGVGLVTTLYVGLPAKSNLVSRLGAMQITQGFLPGALLARALGRRDCLGATMCLRRADLQRIGGFGALVNHLADDNVLGRRIAGLGLDVALADTVPLTTVPEARLGALLRHELRWARTIRALEPVGFAASVLQYPLVWALAAVMLSDRLWSLALFALCWALRAVAAFGVDRALAAGWGKAGQGSDDAAGLAFRSPVWLLPIRDILSVAVLLASYGGRQVDWRGHGMLADTPPRSAAPDTPLRPIEEMNAR